MNQVTSMIPALICIIGGLMYLFLPDENKYIQRLRWLAGVAFGVGLFWWIGAK